MLIRLFSFLLLIFISLKLTGQSKRSIKLFQEANSNYSIGEFENAIEIYNRIIKSEPENCNAIYRIGLAYRELKKYNDFNSL